MERGVDGVLRAEVLAVLEQVGASHPAEPHWYLPAIGVDPRFHGRGYSSALLARSLEVCDRDHGTAYLETTNPANISLYRRFGFEVVGAIQAGSSPTINPMLRVAR
jgi:ribosomal protein S18 acetylase RimI-like enzyme